MNLSKNYDPKRVEAKIYNLWMRSGFFNPDKLPKRHKKPYCIVVPPPNITGELHMGHALNLTIQDILIRWQRLQGKKTLWLPGTDHAGIATQVKVEKELKKQGLTRFDLGREKFIEKVWQWQEKYGNIILDQFKKLGCSLDWSRTRFTLDKEYLKAIEAAFLHYYKKGWIYKGERCINWCPRCSTSLSDLELVYKEEPAEMYYIKYGPVTIATVRPETKLGDTAIAVNPKDERYKKYIGQTLDIQTVLGPAKMRVIGEESVDMNFGTGAMKVTPAHDIHDFELGEKHKLERKQVIGPDGRMTSLAGKYAGLTTIEARKQIVEDMKKIGILEKVEPYTHNAARCYRCNTLIEPILSKQWFLKMQELAKLAEEPIRKGEIKFHPKSFEKGYLDWLKNVRDWCISRQLWWGHQLPVWFCQTGRISNSQFPISKQFENLKLKIKNSSAEQFIISDKQPDQCPFCKKCKMEQSADVLDTWFSSALWPFATLGWPKKTKDLEKFYPTNVLSTARDIINLWVTRMVFSGMEFMGKIPFKDVYIHATVLTKEGKRMSKSLGTGIDPLALIEKYGADATRFGISWQIMGGQDIRFTEENIMMGKKFCNKIWNISRYILMKVPGNWDEYIKNEKFPFSIDEITGSESFGGPVRAKVQEITKSLEQYRFGEAAHIIYDYIWHNIADKYIETTKNKEGDEEVKSNLVHYLINILKLLHPFMPFITEEIYQQLPIKNKKECLMIEAWPWPYETKEIK